MIKKTITTHWFYTTRAETINGRRICFKQDAVSAFEESENFTLIHLGGERILINVKFDDFKDWIGQFKQIEENENKSN